MDCGCLENYEKYLLTRRFIRAIIRMYQEGRVSHKIMATENRHWQTTRLFCQVLK